jgi:hypothetical protein
LLEEPSLFLRREEGVHEVVVALVRDLERLVFDAAVDLFLSKKENLIIERS